jgi:hypothetical protein
VTTGITVSSDDEFQNDDFFPDIGNLNMGYNTDADVAANAPAAVNARPYVIYILHVLDLHRVSSSAV